MKKLIIAACMSLMLMGCNKTFVDVSPSQSYRPAGSKNLWDITGSLNTDYNEFTNELTRFLNVQINGEPVIRGSLSRQATGELSGTYKNHKVNSICTSEQKTETWIDVRCIILIDNERAATLSF